MSDGQSHASDMQSAAEERARASYGHLTQEELDAAFERALAFRRLVEAAERDATEARRRVERELDDLWAVWAERRNRG